MPRKLRLDYAGGVPQDSPAGLREFGQQTERRRLEEDGADDRALERGWCLGSEESRQELLAAAVERVGMSHYGADRQETGEQKAQRIVLEEMKRLRWEETDLHQRRKGDAGKGDAARRLRQETPVSLKWIAQRLHMDSWTYVLNLLHAKPAYCVNSED